MPRHAPRDTHRFTAGGQLPAIASTGVESQPGDRPPARLGDGDAAPGRSETTRPTLPAPATWRRVLAGPTGQTVVTGLILAALVHLRLGYQAGGGDHLTLSAVGLSWAHPDWFVNDWALAHAPRPDLLFDTITWFGAKTGTLGAIYLCYWLAAMAVFASATTLLARAWAPRHAWLAGLAVTVVMAMVPLSLLGAQTPLLAAALPSVLGGALVYLGSAALLTGRERVATGVLLATVVVDVSAGVVLGLLLATATSLRYRRVREADRMIVGGLAVALVLVVVTLIARPALGGVGALAEACRALTPDACDASAWVRTDLRSSAATALLALFAMFFADRATRSQFLVVLGVPSVLLFGAAGVEYLGLPGLTPLAQALDVHRMGIVLVPFIGWGVVAPVLANATARQRWLGLLAMMVMVIAATEKGHWALDEDVDQVRPPWLAIICVLLVFACAALTVPHLVRRPAVVTRVALVGLVVLTLLAGAAGDLAARRFDPRFRPVNDDLAAWGADVERVVPPDALIIVPPWEVTLRMATHRAVLVDCAYRPYGGASLAEYKTRLDAIGGQDQCEPRTTRTTTYGDADLARTARSYGARYIVVDVNQDWRTQALVAAGWSVVVSARNTAGLQLLMAPWT